MEFVDMMNTATHTTTNRAWFKWLAISAIVFILDQITKHAVTANFQLGDSKYILPFFNLVLAHNTGAAFSFLANASGWQREFFIVITIIITAVLLWMMRSNRHNRLLCVALSLVIGGAFGNLYDRVLHGYVVDFVQWHAGGYYWPAFNIADSAICVGAALLIWDSFRKPATASS
jgi:signal peptidase II